MAPGLPFSPAAFEHLPHPVAIFSPSDGGKVYANQRFEASFPPEHETALWPFLPSLKRFAAPHHYGLEASPAQVESPIDGQAYQLMCSSLAQASQESQDYLLLSFIPLNLQQSIENNGREYTSKESPKSQALPPQRLGPSPEAHAQELETALDQAAIVARTDLAGTITDVNEAFCRISGYPREELLGQNHRILNSGQHPPEFFREMWRCIGQGRTWRGDICNRRKDGSRYWVATTIIPLKNVKGQTYQYLAIRFDITQQKENETALQQHKKALEKALEDKQRLYQEMHHRVANNLNMAATILQMQKGATQDSQCQQTLTQSTNRIKTIARVHRYFYEAGGEQSIDLKDYFKNFFTLLRSSADYRQLDYHIEAPQGLVMNFRKLTHLGLLLHELMLNSMKHAFSNQPQPAIKLRFEETENGQIRLEYRDNGQGYPETSDQKANPVGARIIQAMAANLEGKTQMYNEGGSVFEMVFPS